MNAPRHFLVITTALFLSSPAQAIHDLKIDGEVEIVPIGVGVRKMLGIARHPNGAIYLNTQHQGLLFKSTDEGQSWTPIPVVFPSLERRQVMHGFGITRDGHLWVFHQSWKFDGGDAFISHSSDGGWVWKTTSIDFPSFAPNSATRPYDRCLNDYNTFVERSDDTLMIGIGLRYSKEYTENSQHYLNDRLRPDVWLGGETMIRTTDGGQTWADPTPVHPHLAEVGYAVDPKGSDRVLAMARIQRRLLAGEDRAAHEKRTGCVPGVEYVYKQGLLLESNDAGRTFHEVEGSLTEYYGHRGTILWTNDNTVVITHQGGVPGESTPDGQLYARISLDGGRSWLNSTETPTQQMAQSTKFLLLPQPPGHSFTAPTVELGPGRFLTVYTNYDLPTKTTGVRGIFWRIIDRN